MSRAKSKSSNSKAQTWPCLSCTYVNSASNSTCEVCDTEKQKDFTLRFKTPTEIFTISDVAGATTVGEMKVLIESRSGIAVPLQKLFYGHPRRELFGREKEHVVKVLSVELAVASAEAPCTITVEIKSAPKPAATSSSVTAAVPEADEAWTEPTADDSQFIAWLEYTPGSGGLAALVSPSSAAKAAAAEDADEEMKSTKSDAMEAKEDDDWGADGGDDGGDGWGDDADGGDDFLDEEDAEQLATMHKKKTESKQEEAATTTQSSRSNRKLGEYEILNLTQLHTMMKASLAELVESIGCTMNEAAILMRHYKWSKERLFAEYLNDAEKVQDACGLSRMHRTPSEPSVGAECPLCGDEMTATNSIDLGCTDDGSHRFCLECYRNWTKAEMDKGPQAVFTTCCGFRCKELLPDDTFLHLLPARKRALLSKWFIRNYVDANPHLKWCINPNCNLIVRFQQGGARDIECDCGCRFCFSCLLPESHSPCQCELVAEWNKKNSSDADNSNWILANTKQCPGCKVAIEKNSGCNHMTCKSCKHEFCWLCFGKWSEHGSASGGYYACNVFESKKKSASSSVSAQEKTREEAAARLAKYQFYFERWMEYEKSIKMAVARIPETESRMERLQEITGGDLNSVNFLLAANQTVIECRRALKWSYVIAYYLKPESRQLHLFQIDQGQLELFSDELHGLIERPLEQMIPTNAHALGGSTFAASAYAAALTDTKSPKNAPPRTTTPKSTTSSAAASAIEKSAAAAAGSIASSSSPTNMQGEELIRYIQAKTATANKYLCNLVDAVQAGMYLDLNLQRASSLTNE